MATSTTSYFKNARKFTANNTFNLYISSSEAAQYLGQTGAFGYEYSSSQPYSPYGPPSGAHTPLPSNPMVRLGSGTDAGRTPAIAHPFSTMKTFEGQRLGPLCFLGDTTGNGLLDIIDFASPSSGVQVSLANTDGSFQPPRVILHDFTYAHGGWMPDIHPRTVADLTGDGLVDLVGFGDAGVYVAFNNGDGIFQQPRLIVEDFGASPGGGGWEATKHPRFIADLTGDRRGDIVGFGGAGVYASYNNGNGTFQRPRLVVKDFGYEAGDWRVEHHPRHVVDLTGTGMADIVGFGDNAVWVSYNDGRGNFGPVQELRHHLGTSN